MKSVLKWSNEKYPTKFKINFLYYPLYKKLPNNNIILCAYLLHANRKNPVIFNIRGDIKVWKTNVILGVRIQNEFVIHNESDS